MAKSFPNGSRRGKHALADQRRREADPRVQRAAEETRRHQEQLEARIQREQEAASQVEVIPVLTLTEEPPKIDVEEIKEKLKKPQPAVVVPDVPVEVKLAPFGVDWLGEGKWQFAFSTARLMLQQGYHIKYICEMTGIGYAELEDWPLDADGYAIPKEEE